MFRCGRSRFKLLLCPLLTAAALFLIVAQDHKNSIIKSNSNQALTFHKLSYLPKVSDSVGLRGVQGVDCVAALEDRPATTGNEHVSKPVVGLSEKDLLNETLDCGSLRERHGYERYGQASEEELRFPLAYNVLLYKDVEQLHVLLRAIYRPHNSYCLHVDGYALPSVLRATRRLASCLQNVFVASRRENITYAGFSRLQADINCMEDHWSHPVPWRYLLNLPSQQFPLKTNAELVKILTVYNGSNDVEGILGKRMLGYRYEFKHKYVPQDSSGRFMLKRTGEKHQAPPHDIKVVKGSAYGVFSRGFVDYVLHDQRAKDLLEWCRPVASPDEYYWATLNHNPHIEVPGGYKGAADKKPWLAVYASWYPRDPCFSGKHVRGICIFGLRDLPQLVARKEFFANKFYLDFEPQALHCLDHWLFNKSRPNVPFDLSYYRQLPFIRKNG